MKIATPEQRADWHGRRKNVAIGAVVFLAVSAIAFWEVETIFGTNSAMIILVLFYVALLYGSLIILPLYLRCPACLATWQKEDPLKYCKDCGVRYDA